MTEHCDDGALLALLDENEHGADLAAIRRHLAECRVCSEKLEELRHWSALFAEAATWQLQQRSADYELDRNTASEPSAALANLIQRVFDEDAAAAAFVTGLPHDDISLWLVLINQNTRVQTLGLVRALLDQARARHNQAPLQAVQVLDSAMVVLQRIQPLDIRLEGDIWKERANAFRLLGRYGEALVALDDAERCYQRCVTWAYDCGFVYWSRATTFFATKRFRDARFAIQRAAEIFRSHGDEVRLAQIRILEASILFDEGDIAAARATFAALEPVLRGLGDDESRARVLANLAGCEVRLGETAAAVDHADVAARLYDELHMEAEAVRLCWSLGDALKLEGKTDEALRALRRAAVHFEALEMKGAVASVGLDTAELLNERGEFEEATEISARLVGYFRNEGADVDAANAVYYLQRAIEAMVVTPELFDYLRLYLIAREAGESTDFRPPTQGTIQ